MNTSAKIRVLLKKGVKPVAIAKQLKIKAGYVYQIRWKDQQKAGDTPKKSGSTLSSAKLARCVKLLAKAHAILKG